MGIHYDYKSTRGEKAMKKEAKRKARIEQRRAKKLKDSPISKEKEQMHDIDKPITLEDLTNPDKSQISMREILKKVKQIKLRGDSLKKNLKKRKRKNITPKK